MSTTILLAGETWFTHGTHVKGFGSYETGHYAEGQTEFVEALRSEGVQVDHLPNHIATERFPWTMDELSPYDVVVLSDIPADTLQLHPTTFDRGERTTDRLALLRDWVDAGGGLLMVGGYMSFSGFAGKARFQNTPLADVLPVQMLGYDDRIETPAGVAPKVESAHPVLDGIDDAWPHFLGYQRLIARPDADVALSVGEDPFLALGTYGSGRAAAFASDCSPHWGSPAFLAWPSYARFWSNLIAWTGAEQ